MGARDRRIRDRIAENDLTVMRSYLEVDFADWLSENEVPFGYEAFVIPSVVGPGKEKWDHMAETIRKIGSGERETIKLPTGEVMDTADILYLWNDIYEKHKLAEETITVDPNPALAGFQKRMLLPDFAIYNDADTKTAGEGFDWTDYDYIVEVSGLYGVGLPEESDDDDWWQWYRVSAVAFKELAYRLLGLWDKVYFVLPNQAYVEGVTEGLPRQIREDDHYFVMNTTQLGLELGELADRIGVTDKAIDRGLSPTIQPTKYMRPLDTTTQFEMGSITPVEYTFTGVNIDRVPINQDAVLVEDGIVVFHGEMGEVYIDGTDVRVRESQWRNMNMILLREYVLQCLNELSEDGIVEGLTANI